jgi:predicted small metal-binding protein
MGHFKNVVMPFLNAKKNLNDVLRKAAEHAKTAHNMDSIPPDVLSKVKGAIHDEGDARTQKAGSSN